MRLKVTRMEQIETNPFSSPSVSHTSVFTNEQLDNIPVHQEYLPSDTVEHVHNNVNIKKNKYYNILVLLLIGFVLGAVFAVIVFLVMYYTNLGPFSYCSASSPECRTVQYFNNPTNALRNGATMSDILFISNNQMSYKRVPRDTCSPGSNQIVPITYPQYCSFSDGTGTATQFRDSFFEANIYRNGTEIVRTSGNCVPVDSDTYTTGTIVMNWDG